MEKADEENEFHNSVQDLFYSSKEMCWIMSQSRKKKKLSLNFFSTI